MIRSIAAEIDATEGSFQELILAMIRAPQFRARGRTPKDGG
jgi:hypothetical protein